MNAAIECLVLEHMERLRGSVASRGGGERELREAAVSEVKSLYFRR